MNFIADEKDFNTRIDNAIKCRVSFSREFIQKKIDLEMVLVNQKPVKNSYKLRIADNIVVLDDFFHDPQIDLNEIKPYNIPLDIVFQDEDIIVINKPAGLTTHPGAGNHNETLMNALVFHFQRSNLSDSAGLKRLGIVHRLDKDTSGLMVVAKNNIAHSNLSDQLKSKDTFYREYLAICNGVPMPTSGSIERYMKKGSFADGRMVICNKEDSNARYSKTDYQVEKILAAGKFSLVKCRLHTGRTHQIRLHFCDINHALVGDVLYKHARYNIPQDIQNYGQLLQAKKLCFLHPRSKKNMVFEIDISKKINEFIRLVK